MVRPIHAQPPGVQVRFGDLSLSESLYFLAHDPFTGKPRTRRQLVDIGLAGAVLADLLFDERITLDNGTVVRTSRSPTGEPIADRALEHIVAEPAPHSVRDWVEYLRPTIFDTVTENLMVRQMLTLREKRGVFRLSLYYEPPDLKAASAPRALVRAAMLNKSTLDLPITALTVLAGIIGLDDICLPELSRVQLANWVERVKATIEDPLGGLIAGVDAAVAAAVLGGRR